MITVDQIRDRLLALLSAQDIASSLDGFDAWLAAESWNMHQHSDLAAQQLTSAIELNLAEYEAGHRNITELRAEFESMIGINSALAHSEAYASTPGSVSAQVRVSSHG